MKIEYKYCPQCGEALIEKEVGDEGLIPFCASCSIPFMPTPRPCVIVAVMNSESEIALIKQDHVSKTHWVLVAGHITEGENAEETAVREVAEETGLKVKSVKYLSSYDYAQRSLLMLGFIAIVEKGEFGHSKEVQEIRWFSLEDAEHSLREGSIALKHFKLAKTYYVENALQL